MLVITFVLPESEYLISCFRNYLHWNRKWCWIDENIGVIISTTQYFGGIERKVLSCQYVLWYWIYWKKKDTKCHHLLNLMTWIALERVDNGNKRHQTTHKLNQTGVAVCESQLRVFGSDFFVEVHLSIFEHLIL